MAVMDLAAVAEEHARLLEEMAQYDNARAELHDTKVLIATLEKDFQDREADLRGLVAKRKSEHKDLEKLQRSSSWRLFFRLAHGGSGLARKLEQEEREYIEAAQAEHLASQALSEAHEATENLRVKRKELEERVQKRKEVKARIDDLFKSAFDGPTPGFPEEDLAEDELRAAELHNEQVQSDLSREQFAFTHLDRAATCAIQAMVALQNASANASYDTLVVGGVWADMAERDYIMRGQSLSAEAQRMLTLARSANSLVKNVPCGRIIEPQWLGIMFDDLFAEYMFRQKVRQAIESARVFRSGVCAERSASGARLRGLKRAASDASVFLAERRAALAAIRKDILRRIKEGDADMDVFEVIKREGVAPPAYERNPEPGTRVIVSSLIHPSATEVISSGSVVSDPSSAASLAANSLAKVQASYPLPQPPKYDIPHTPPPPISTSTSTVAVISTPLAPASVLASTSGTSVPETLSTFARPKSDARSGAQERNSTRRRYLSPSPVLPVPEANGSASLRAPSGSYLPAPLSETESAPAPSSSMPKSPRLRPILNLGAATPSPMPTPLQHHGEAADAFAPLLNSPLSAPMWRAHPRYGPPAGPPPPPSPSGSKLISSLALEEVETARSPSPSRITRPKYAPPPGPPPSVHRPSPILAERSRPISSSQSARLVPPPPITPSSILMPQSQYPPHTLLDGLNAAESAMTRLIDDDQQQLCSSASSLSLSDESPRIHSHLSRKGKARMSPPAPNADDAPERHTQSGAPVAGNMPSSPALASNNPYRKVRDVK